MPRLYHFYFEGIEKPITIQTDNLDMAKSLLKQKLPSLPEYSDKMVIDEKTEGLVTGVSTRVCNGKTMTWNGSTWK